jgi:formamidopyrimidine-DNA glycosylase
VATIISENLQKSIETLLELSGYNVAMPELPEVETIRLGLQQYLPEQTITSASFDWPKGFPNSPELVQTKLIGAKIESVDRRGKAIIMPLSSGYSLLIHLKMTGQLVYRPNTGKGFGGGHPTNSLIGSLPDKSTRVELTLSKGTLFFNDQRKFGWVKLEETDGLYERNAFLSKLGPEPLDDSYTFDIFKSAVQRRKNTSIKAAILDQSVLAGVGNIYADEGLFAARIHPATKVANVSTIKLHKLFDALRAVMRLSISHGGSSDRNYVNAEGKKGSYLTFAKVFRREGQTCPECGGVVEKIRVAGRGTHFCPRCQKLPKVSK